MAAPRRCRPRARGRLNDSGRAHPGRANTAAGRSRAAVITAAAASFETAIDSHGWSHERVIDQQVFADMLASLERLADEGLPVDSRRAPALRANFSEWAAELR